MIVFILIFVNLRRFKMHRKDLYVVNGFSSQKREQFVEQFDYRESH